MTATENRLGFDRFVIDAGARRLMRDGREIPINGKAFDLLLLLAERSGSVVAREELYERLWPGGCVEDGNLTQHVYLIRRALDPAGDGRAFVETIPRYGYRFLKPLRAAAPARARLNLRWGVAAAVVLAASLVAAGTRTPPPPANAGGEAYALGAYHLELRTPIDLQYAISYFRTAAADAPANAAGYAGVATAYALLAEYEVQGSPRERVDLDSAKSYLREALARDATSSDALALAGFIAYRFDDDWVSGRNDLERAIVENPDNATAHLWYGIVLLQADRLPQAIGEFETAHRLRPTAEIFSRWLARAYTYAQRPGAAIAAATQAVQIEPGDAPAELALAGAFEQLGKLAQARNTLELLGRLDPDERRYVIPDVARLDLRMHSGDRSRIRSQIDRLAAGAQVDPFEAALFYLTAGLRSRAASVLRERRTSRLEIALERDDARWRAFHAAL